MKLKKWYPAKVFMLLALLLGAGFGFFYGENSRVLADSVSGFWQYQSYNGTVTITKYNGIDANLVIPDTIEGKKVTSLGSNSFAGNKWIVSVTVPATVTSIGYQCFSGCEILTNINGMNGVTEIGNSAFYDCSNLGSVELGNSLKTIGDHAFKNCTKMSSCTFPASLAEIRAWCFENTGLTSVSIPANVTLGSGVFYNCKNLSTVSINSDVSGDLFHTCPNLTTVSIGVNADINYSAFYDCTSLKNLTIAGGEQPIIIGKDAFRNCISLENVSIPSNVRYLYESSFEGCVALKNLTLSYGLLEIGDYAFYGCSSLNNVVVPNSVTSLGYEAFNNSGVNSLVIPNSVISIEDELSDESAVIQCYSGSTANKYAVDNNYQMILLQAVPSTAITFSTATVYMNVDDVRRLSFSITPSNTTDAIRWESSNTNIVSVNGLGEVTAKGVGSVGIVATATSGIRSTINIVVANKPNAISFAKSRETILVGQTVTQKAIVKDPTGVRTDIIPTYSSSNPQIASVDAQGTVTGLGEGTVKITAKTGSLSASYEVIVVSNNPISVSFDSAKKTVVIGHKITQKAKVMGSAGQLTTVKPTYTSSNPKIASVSGAGQVTGKKAGTVTIRAKVGSLTASYKVTVETMTVKKSGKTLTVTTIPKAKVTVKAKKSILGKSSKSVKANAKGVAKIKFKKNIKKVTVKITVAKSGYKKKTITKKY